KIVLPEIARFEIVVLADFVEIRNRAELAREQSEQTLHRIDQRVPGIDRRRVVDAVIEQLEMLSRERFVALVEPQQRVAESRSRAVQEVGREDQRDRSRGDLREELLESRTGRELQAREV